MCIFQSLKLCIGGSIHGDEPPFSSFGSFPEKGILGVLRLVQDLLPSTGNVAGHSVAGGSFLTNGIPEGSQISDPSPSGKNHYALPLPVA